MTIHAARLLIATFSAAVISSFSLADDISLKVSPNMPAQILPLHSVRLIDSSPFTAGASANQKYLLALEPDRLLAPFLREAGLKPKAASYENWESGGLDGHTGGHYLSALADMIAAGHDTPEGELNRRLDYMIDELEKCQQASGNGYIGGVPGSRAFWEIIAAGDVGKIGSKWVPWYNVHKTYAGLRDAYLVAGKTKARDLLIKYGDWCVNEIAKLSDAQMQQMLNTEYGGMNESLADIYAITGDEKYLTAAKRFDHQSILQPLEKSEDQLTGKHANTQIPKIIGFARIGNLTGDKALQSAAKFFWETVTKNRSVAFGGNSVAEHFNDPKNFRGLLEHREGPETCNTYNMLRLTEQLFAAEPRAEYADYYERALFNHLLSAINTEKPGYVYFTPIRPEHYRVYSTPETCFWCCVGTGMENPGKYGEFIYARSADGVYVNLFIPSQVQIDGLNLRQETKFPYEAKSRITVNVSKPTTTKIRVRHPKWVSDGKLAIRVNGEVAKESADSKASSYVELNREWKNGDVIEIDLPMSLSSEKLPDGSNWAAILYGPIVLAAPSGTEHLDGLFADGSRMGHVAHGPQIPLDQVPALLSSQEDLLSHVTADPKSPLSFVIKDIATTSKEIQLVPFFSLHGARYQMYWELTTAQDLAARKVKLAADEAAKAAREAATIDSVAIGEQQPEVEHDFKGENSKTGTHENRRWRDGASFQYTLNSRGEKAADLELTLWGGDNGRKFDVLINDDVLATIELNNSKPGEFIQKRFSIPAAMLDKAKDGKLTVKFVAKLWVAGGIFDVRLMKPEKK